MTGARITERRILPEVRHGALSALLEAALERACGDRPLRLVSLALEIAAPAASGEAVIVTAWVERATRTLVFAAGEARREADGALAASASAVFKAPPPA